MSATISLGFYTIRAHKRGHRDKNVELQSQNLSNNLDVYFKSLAKFDPDYKHEKEQKKKENNTQDKKPKLIFLENDVYSFNKNRIKGRIRAGEGGISSDIVDSETGKRKLKRKIEDVEILPFYFEIDIPEKKGIPLLAIQRLGVYGVASQITSGLRKNLATQYPELTIEINPVFVGSLYLDKYVSNGEIKEIEVIKHEIPKDTATGIKGVRQKYTITLTPEKRGESLGFLNKYFSKDTYDSKNVIKNVISAFELNIEAEELKVQIELNGKKRTIDVGNIERFATHYDISDDVVRDENEHPQLSSIDGITQEIIANDIRKIIK